MRRCVVWAGWFRLGGCDDDSRQKCKRFQAHAQLPHPCYSLRCIGDHQPRAAAASPATQAQLERGASCARRKRRGQKGRRLPACPPELLAGPCASAQKVARWQKRSSSAVRNSASESKPTNSSLAGCAAGALSTTLFIYCGTPGSMAHACLGAATPALPLRFSCYCCSGLVAGVSSALRRCRGAGGTRARRKPPPLTHRTALATQCHAWTVLSPVPWDIIPTVQLLLTATSAG